MELCGLNPKSVSLLVKEHLLPNSEGEGWRSAWGSECALQEGMTIRIPYDPYEINAILVTPVEVEDPTTESDGSKDAEVAESAYTADLKSDAVDLAGSSTDPSTNLDVDGGSPPRVGTDPTNTSGGVTTSFQNPLPPINDGGEVQEIPMPEDQEDAQELTAHEEVDPTAGLTGELTSLVESTGADPTLTIILAMVAVLGGGTAWKFYRQHSEQKHEQRMQEMKMEAQTKGLGGKSPGPCRTVHAQLKAEVEELKSRLGKMDKKLMLNADFDGDDTGRRIRRLEKWRKVIEEDTEDA